MSFLYFHGTCAYKHSLFSIFPEELTTVCNPSVALLQTRIPRLTKKIQYHRMCLSQIFWCVQQILTSKYQPLKSYFCILYSKFLKVETTELKCLNHPNSYPRRDRDILSIHLPSSYSFPSCGERKWKW